MNLKQQLVKKLTTEFPQIIFKKVDLVTKGYDHDVLVLDDNFVVRFAKKRLSKKSFVREIKFLKEFSKISNLAVPKYSFISKDKSFGGYEMIKGKELTPKLYKSLSVSKKQKIIRDLAKFLTILHSTPLQKARQFHFSEYASWGRVLVEKQKWFDDEFYAKIKKYLTQRQYDFIKNFIEYFCNSQYHIRPVLGHYDLSHDHIIMNGDGTIAGIIDFGDINISDPAHEFNGFWDYDEKLPKQIYKYYGGPKDKNFLKRCRDHFIHRWIYLLYDGKVRRKNEDLWKEAKQRIDEIIKAGYNFH